MLNDRFDLFFTEDGEFLIDESRKDFERAYESEAEVLLQTIIKRLQSSHEDWGLQGAVYSDLAALVGSPRSDAVISEAMQMVQSALIEDNLVSPERLRINMEGYDANILMLNITIYGEGSEAANIYNLGFSYDMRDNRCIPRYILGKGVSNG
jgi:hypothetical protein